MKEKYNEEDKEKVMYPLVEKYLINQLEKKYECDRNIFSNNASVADLSLDLYGSYIKPDVYAVGENKDGVFRTLMAEGKITYKGRNLDGVIWQGTSDQRFSHYAYIFFPKKEIEDSEKIGSYLIQECKKFGLGLLLVDAENVKEILAPKFSSISTDEIGITNFERNCLYAKNKIKTVDNKIEAVHLTTLRDLSTLLATKISWSEKDIVSTAEGTLLQEYKKRGTKSSLEPYDAKVRKPAINGDSEKFKEIINRNLKVMEFFNLVTFSPKEKELTLLGRVFANVCNDEKDEGIEENKYGSHLNNTVKDALTYIMFINEETKKLMEAIYTILKEHNELPVWPKKKSCPTANKCNRKCGFNKSTSVQPFPNELLYDSKTKKHKCEINGQQFDFANLTLISLLYCSFDKMLLPEKLKILISESSLVKQAGKSHSWSLNDFLNPKRKS